MKRRRLLVGTEGGELRFWCPGCDAEHTVHHGMGGGPRWTWNGDAYLPTLSPSVLVQGVAGLTEDQHEAYLRGEGLPEAKPFVCHSFVTGGEIHFLLDSTHALAGKTVPLPEWPR